MATTTFTHKFEIGDIIVHKGDGAERKITEIRITDQGELYQARLMKEGDYNHAVVLLDYVDRIESRYWKKDEPSNIIDELAVVSVCRLLLHDLAERDPKLFMDVWNSNK